MNVILYCRVSTAEQATDGVSLAAQKRKLLAYADLYDLDVVDVVTDAGESAKTLKRPGLQKALGLIKNCKADGLVIAKLDRLTRSISDWQELIDRYFSEKAGKALYSLGDSIDTTTAAGRLVLNVLLSVAQWEREAIGERTSAALQHKRSMNERVSKATFGFDIAPNGIELVPNHKEQMAIRIIRRLRTKGLSYRKIAAELEAREIKTKTGNSKWQHTAVQYILKTRAPA